MHVCEIYTSVYVFISMYHTVNHWSPLLERECSRQDVASAASPFSPDCGSTLLLNKHWNQTQIIEGDATDLINVLHMAAFYNFFTKPLCYKWGHSAWQ